MSGTQEAKNVEQCQSRSRAEQRTSQNKVSFRKKEPNHTSEEKAFFFGSVRALSAVTDGRCWMWRSLSWRLRIVSEDAGYMQPLNPKGWALSSAPSGPNYLAFLSIRQPPGLYRRQFRCAAITRSKHL